MCISHRIIVLFRWIIAPSSRCLVEFMTKNTETSNDCFSCNNTGLASRCRWKTRPVTLFSQKSSALNHFMFNKCWPPPCSWYNSSISFTLTLIFRFDSFNHIIWTKINSLRRDWKYLSQRLMESYQTRYLEYLAKNICTRLTKRSWHLFCSEALKRIRKLSEVYTIPVQQRSSNRLFVIAYASDGTIFCEIRFPLTDN